MLTRDPRGFNPRWVKVGGLRVANGIQHADFARRLHNQGIAHAIEDTEDHHRACRLVRQTDFLHAIASSGRVVIDHFSGREGSQYVTGFQAVDSASIQDDHLILSDERQTVDNGNDPAIDQ